MKKKERVKDPDKIKKRDNIFTIILSICDVVAVVVLFLLYGPFNGFRDWLVTTAMSTMNHQYFATTFYSDEYINKVLARHSIKEPDGNTDISKIIGKEENYIDEYDKEILDRNKKDIYKLIEINEKGFSGYLVAIYDPSKIKVTYSKNLGYSGEHLVDMAKRENAVVAINGGGFLDKNGQGTVVKLNDDNTINSFVERKDFNYDEVDNYYKTVNIYKFSKEFSERFYLPFLESYIKAYGNNDYYELVLKVISGLKEVKLHGFKLTSFKPLITFKTNS